MPPNWRSVSKRAPPPGEHLVDVRLVTGVPDELVARRFEHAVQRDGELDGAEARGDVPAGALHHVDGVGADLLAELQQIVLRQRAKVARIVDALEHGHRPHTTGACSIFRLTRRSSPVRPATSELRSCAHISHVGRTSPPRCATRPRARRCAPLSLTSRATQSDPRLLVIEADPADATAMDALVERVLRAWGRIDILNNLAGTFKGGSALDTRSHARDVGQQRAHRGHGRARPACVRCARVATGAS